MSEASTSATAPKPKRSFFKKSSWQTTKPKTEDKDDDAVAMFSRSGESFKEIVKEQESNWRALEQARKEKGLENATNTPKRKSSVDSDEDEETDGVKRSKIEGSDDAVRTPSRITRSISKSQSASPEKIRKHSSPKPLSKRYEELMSRKYKAPMIVNLDSSDDEDVKPVLLPTEAEGARTNSGGASNVPIVSSKFNLQALPPLTNIDGKQAAAQQDAEVEERPTAIPDGSPVGASAKAYPTPVEECGPDAIVEVLIETHLPDIPPLIVKINYSMKFGEVLKSWLDHFQVGPGLRPLIFLTYKNQKIHKWTSSKSLGIRPDNFDEMSKVHLVATTQQLLDEAKRELAKNKTSLTSLSHDAAPPEEPEETVKRIKIVLKARGYNDFKLQVKPETTMDQIANAFRKERGVPADKKIAIMFDGDRLEDTMAMQDTEIESGEMVEVHIS